MVFHEHLLLHVLHLVPFFLLLLISDGTFWTGEYCGDTLVNYPLYVIDTNSSSPYIGYQGLGVTCLGVPMIYLNHPSEVNAYILNNINYTAKTLTLVDLNVAGKSTCPRLAYNLTIDGDIPLEFSRQNLNLTFYFNCSSDFVHGLLIDCSSLDGNSSHVVEKAEPEYFDWVHFCDEKVSTTLIRRGITDGWTNAGFERVMEQGFELQWRTSTDCDRCEKSNGLCGFNGSRELLCFCNDGSISNTYCKTDTKGNTPTANKSPPRFTPPPILPGIEAIEYGIPSPGGLSKGITLTPMLILLIVGPAVALAIVILIVILYRRVRNSVGGSRINLPDEGLTRLPDRKENKVSAFMKQFESIGPKRYSYSNIRDMTNSFADKLGQGGFGSVYKGKLPDGRAVAVKVLDRAEENGDDFINEVGSISRTSHVNVITLLGFCYHGKRRALIFEYMPNGSLDRFLSSDLDSCLDWKTLFKISIGSARGLEYLHRGCNTRIVHFDIKPHNILLDENFSPKISDFGLAKLSVARESILSKCSARGTAGYIAPEVFYRQFGVVSHKSDVYSYGMMILEMVGVRTNPGVQVDRSSQNYFPQWIYNHLELGSDLNIQAVHDEEEEEIYRKLIMVGLWCIQTSPSDRPAMDKVVEMLEGRLEALQMPPKPFLQSPPKPTQPSSHMSTQQFSASFL